MTAADPANTVREALETAGLIGPLRKSALAALDALEAQAEAAEARVTELVLRLREIQDQARTDGELYASQAIRATLDKFAADRAKEPVPGRTGSKSGKEYRT